MKGLNQVFTEKYYLSDGGLETTLIFHNNIPLNHFAAFELLRNEKGRKVLEEYYKPYLSLAEKYQAGFVIESPTWRSNADWGFKLGYTHDELFALNKQSIKFIREIAASFTSLPQVIVSGNIGPRGDGYRADFLMTAEQSKAYHSNQVKAFALADADIVTAATITYSNEAIGIVDAARSFGLPVVISFTVETDGKLPGGESLQEAVEKVDAATDHYAEHFMVNCAHPQHFINEFHGNGHWKSRIGGIRGNASVKSHAELDESTELDSGDKCLLASGYAELFTLLPSIKVVGGCCGTDWSHLEEICESLQGSLVP
jgi:S-methylmethionine-dependent homocysteine/selenocysteine methylase